LELQVAILIQVTQSLVNKMEDIYTKPALALIDDESKEEVIGLRNANSKTFKTGQDTFQGHIGGEQVQKQVGDKWEEIDLEIVENNGILTVKNAKYDIEIFTHKVGYKFSSLEHTYEMELVKCGDDKVDNSRFKTHYEGHQLFWDDVAEGINVKVQLFTSRAECFIELRDENSPKKFTWKITDASNNKFTSKGGDLEQNSLEIKIHVTEKINNSYFFTEEWTGRVSRISDKKTRIKKWYSDAKFPVVLDPTVTIGIILGNDNGTEKIFTVGTTSPVWYSNVIQMGWNASNHTKVYGGFRFQSVNIPVGSTINSAQFKLSYTDRQVQSMKLYGDKIANAPAWSNSSRPSQITKTAASSNVAFLGNSASTPTPHTINITNQIASIIGLGGWAANNAMRFGILSPTLSANRNSASVYPSAGAARLIIDYTAPTPPATGNPKNYSLPYQAITHRH